MVPKDSRVYDCRMCARLPFAITFYEDPGGDKPVLRWIGSLFEFRLRLNPRVDGESGSFRVFCHAAGDQAILLLGGYDKGRDPSRRRQALEIGTARRRLAEYLQRRRAQ